MRTKRLINRKEVEIIISKYHIEISKNNNEPAKYIINNDGTIDVDGDVSVRYSNLKRLPLKFGTIYGDFNCSNLKLNNLKGSPSYISGNFVCKENQLKTLKYGPKYVGNNYDCSHNIIESLEGCANHIGRDLICNNNKLVNLKGCPEIIQGYLNCKMNKLKSLVGSPKQLYGKFHLSYNQLTNLEGSPQKIWGEIYATSNFLNNLKGLSPDFEGKLFLDASTKSISTGLGLVDFKNTKLELRIVKKFNHNFMPLQLMDHHQYIDLIFKYQQYYEIWYENDELDNEQFSILIEDLNDGLL